MCWSMRIERAIAAAFLIVGAAQDAGAGTPFPQAQLTDGATGEPARRRLRAMEGGELLPTVTC